jgi:ATP-dependent RNA helicase DDX51/DBP6
VYESKKTQRPVKRPRLEAGDVAVPDDLVAEEMEIDEPMGDFEPSIRTLPSFPLPTLPDAPSKSVLALQGLDQALIDADVVHPSTVLPIPDAEDDDGGTRLSAKVRKRLKSIGITELFAGMC